MTDLLLYSIQVTIVFSILFIVYRIVLSSLTFYTINRYLLLSLIPISFLLPIVDSLFFPIALVISDIPFYENIHLNNVENFKIPPMTTLKSSVDYWSLLPVLYWIGVVFSFTKLIFNILKIVAKKQKSTILQKVGYKLIIGTSSQIFSFFNWIFIPIEQKDNYDNLIIEHEKAHISLKHSVDIIIVETYLALFWYNPLVYFYRKSLKSVHEFQADNSVLNKQIKTSQYLRVLLQNLDNNNPNTIYNYFNYPILKKRIDMITKKRSMQLSKLNYLILIPVCAILLFAFAKPYTNSIPKKGKINTIHINNSLPSIFPIKNMTKDDISSVFGVERKHPRTKKVKVHSGIDIKAAIGTPVIATANGTISKATMEGNWGNLVVIAHANGYQTWYAHLNDFNITKDQSVNKGDIIGYVGTTGLSMGPHLHYEVIHNGERVNPMDYITE